MIQWFVEAASSYAAQVDNQVLLITVLVGFWFIAAEVMFFWLIFRFRAKDGVKAQYITGSEKNLKNWINIPHFLIILCDVLIIIGAVRVWMEIKQTLPEPDRVVRVEGVQWAWIFQHPGPDGVLDTADDIEMADELHVEVDKTYHFELTSADVLHSFSIPVFRLKQDAIPGRTIRGWFRPTRLGEHDIQCAEMCGVGHGLMGARIFIESAEQHAAWSGKHTTYASLETETQTETE